MAKTELTLVLPGIARIIEHEINAGIMPMVLSRFLKKAHFKRDPRTLQRLLMNHFSQTALNGSDLPVAALSNTTSTMIKADPCYVHADRDRLLLFADNLELTDAESQALISQIQPLFDDYGGQLSLIDAQNWSLNLRTLPDITLSALPDVHGHDVESFLPMGPERRHWIRLWNEIQMQLHDCDINQQRIAKGKFPINSVWFWGMGNFDLKQHAWTGVRGKLSLLKQLTDLAAIALDTDVDNIKASLPSGKHLWVLDEIDIEHDWQQQLHELNNALFQPLWHQLRTVKINRLTLEIPDHGRYTLNPLMCWKFWP